MNYDETDADKDDVENKISENSNSDQPSHFVPPPIDTSSLVEYPTQRLKLGLIERQDYYLANENVWKKLIGWYGLEGPAIQRKLIAIGEHKTKFEVELYPIRLHVTKIDYVQKDTDFSQESSKLLTIKEMRC